MKNIICYIAIIAALIGLTNLYNYIETSLQAPAQVLQLESDRCAIDQAQNPDLICD